MGIENHVEAKRLRRLRDPQPRALRRRFDVAAAVDQLDGIGDGNRGNGRAGAAGGLDRARNHAGETNGRAASWIRTISGFCAGERFKSGMHRGLARRAAICRRLRGATR